MRGPHLQHVLLVLLSLPFLTPASLRNLTPSSLQLSTNLAYRQSVTGAFSILRTLFESSAQTLFVPLGMASTSVRIAFVVGRSFASINEAMHTGSR